jgi:hypothetical protein
MAKSKRVRIGVSQFIPTDHDDAVLEKILAFWNQCRGGMESGKKFNTWSMIIEKHHAELIKVLDKGDIEGLRTLYSNFWTQPFTYGYVQALPSRKRFVAERSNIPPGWVNFVSSVATATGATKRLRLKSRTPQENITDPHVLATKIEEKTGVAFGIDQELSGGMNGVMINSKLINIKDMQGYLFAHQASHIRGGDTICEIGTGCGHTAYYHSRFGARLTYMFDLPTVAMTAIWFLGRLDGPDAIRIPGEEASPTHKYVIYPFFSFGEAETDFMKFDTLANKISFPEMGTEIASQYFKKSSMYGCNRVYSTNYESQQEVVQISKRDDKKRLGLASDAAELAGWRCISRTPSWMGRSFVDEIFVTPETFR